jgi:hypothetical protein
MKLEHMISHFLTSTIIFVTYIISPFICSNIMAAAPSLFYDSSQCPALYMYSYFWYVTAFCVINIIVGFIRIYFNIPVNLVMDNISQILLSSNHILHLS